MLKKASLFSYISLALAALMIIATQGYYLYQVVLCRNMNLNLLIFGCLILAIALSLLILTFILSCIARIHHQRATMPARIFSVLGSFICILCICVDIMNSVSYHKYHKNVNVEYGIEQCLLSEEPIPYEIKDADNNLCMKYDTDKILIEKIKNGRYEKISKEAYCSATEKDGEFLMEYGELYPYGRFNFCKAAGKYYLVYCLAQENDLQAIKEEAFYQVDEATWENINSALLL